MQLQKLDNVIHIGNLLFPGSSRRLTKKCRKEKSLAYGRSTLMDIHLFTVSRGPLEADPLWTTVNQNRSMNLSTIFPLGEHIE